ncbi:aldehyde dehydrogenase family protein, partial [Microbacterium sp.]|uniref:aldehyde dehydrogenase family protein n=1 Tax=Microbacterium sp. TaxID=51671 RepID=UPI003A8A8867
MTTPDRSAPTACRTTRTAGSPPSDRAESAYIGLTEEHPVGHPAAAHRVGSQLECGYVWVNDHGATRLDLRAPFGGMKQSGIG